MAKNSRKTRNREYKETKMKIPRLYTPADIRAATGFENAYAAGEIKLEYKPIDTEFLTEMLFDKSEGGRKLAQIIAGYLTGDNPEYGSLTLNELMQCYPAKEQENFADIIKKEQDDKAYERARDKWVEAAFEYRCNQEEKIAG